MHSAQKETLLAQPCSLIIVCLSFILDFKGYFGFICDTSSLQPPPLVWSQPRLKGHSSSKTHPGLVGTSNRNSSSQRDQCFLHCKNSSPLPNSPPWSPPFLSPGKGEHRSDSSYTPCTTGWFKEPHLNEVQIMFLLNWILQNVFLLKPNMNIGNVPLALLSLQWVTPPLPILIERSELHLCAPGSEIPAPWSCRKVERRFLREYFQYWWGNSPCRSPSGAGLSPRNAQSCSASSSCSTESTNT